MTKLRCAKLKLGKLSTAGKNEERECAMLRAVRSFSEWSAGVQIVGNKRCQLRQKKAVFV